MECEPMVEEMDFKNLRRLVAPCEGSTVYSKLVNLWKDKPRETLPRKSAAKQRNFRPHKNRASFKADLKRFENPRPLAAGLFKRLLGPRPGAPREVAGIIKMTGLWPVRRPVVSTRPCPSPGLISPFGKSECEAIVCESESRESQWIRV